MFQVRSRLINFRVTEDEFLRLKTAATVQGCRCLSDFARTVMLGTADGGLKPAPDSAGAQVLLLDRRLTALESKVARLMSQMELALAAGVGV